MHRSIVILAYNANDAIRFAKALSPTTEQQGGDHVTLQVANKYFNATIHVHCASFTDWFTRVDPTQVTGVVTLVRGDKDHVDAVPCVATPWLAFDVVVGILCESVSSAFVDGWRDVCIRRNQEWIDSGLRQGFEAASANASRAGLLAGDLVGPDRVVQLVHQTPWTMGVEAASPIVNVASPSNWLLVIADDRSTLETHLAQHFTMDEKRRTIALATKYYNADVNLCFIDASNFSIQMADLLNTQIAAVNPKCVLWFHATGRNVSQCVKGFQLAALRDRLDDGRIENAMCVFNEEPDRLTQQLLMRLHVEPVFQPPATDGSSYAEDGAQGWERVKEVVECCQWAPTPEATGSAPTSTVEAANPAAEPVAHAQPAPPPPPPQLRTEVVFCGVGVTLDDLKEFRKVALQRFSQHDRNDKVTITSKYTSAVVQIKAILVTSTEDASNVAASAQAVIVLAGPAAESELVSRIFASTLPSRAAGNKAGDVEDDDAAFEGDERLRLLIVTEPSDAVDLLSEFDADYRFVVEVCDEDAQAAVDRVGEALEQCRWNNAVPLSQPPAALVVGCQPPPGFRRDRHGRTVKGGDGDDDDGEAANHTLPQGVGDADLFQLATQMRALRQNTVGVPDEVRKERAEKLALKFADMVGAS